MNIIDTYKNQFFEYDVITMASFFIQFYPFSNGVELFIDNKKNSQVLIFIVYAFFLAAKRFVIFMHTHAHTQTSIQKKRDLHKMA